MAYLDNSGLYRKFGTEGTDPTNAGEYSNVGKYREIEFKIDLTELTEEEQIISDVVTMPKHMRFVEIEVVTNTIATGGTAIDFGLVQADDRTTEIDFDGLLAAFPIASMNATGERSIVRVGGTGAGTLLDDTTTTQVGHFTMSRTDGNAFTAGNISIIVRYYRP